MGIAGIRHTGTIAITAATYSAAGRVIDIFCLHRIALPLQAWLGFYNTFTKRLRWSKEDCVAYANGFALTVLGLATPPALEAKTVRKMGLQGVYGLVIGGGDSAGGGRASWGDEGKVTGAAKGKGGWKGGGKGGKAGKGGKGERKGSKGTGSADLAVRKTIHKQSGRGKQQYY